MEATATLSKLDGSRNRTRTRTPVTEVERRNESDLLRRYATTRSPADREAIVERFMGLARSLATRYAGRGEPFEDLVQVANLALVKAVDGFDPERGRPFTAYAVPTIVGELRRHFRDRVPRIHMPRSLQESILSVDRTVAKLTALRGRSPTVKEVAAELGLEDDEVLEALEASNARRLGSLDAPVARADEESLPTIETVGERDAGYDRVDANISAGDADLDEREELVLRLRFGAQMTQTEIGERLGVSQMQISRISRKALHKLLTAVEDDEAGTSAA